MSSAEQSTAGAADEKTLPGILCVDDEPNILSSLRRLLRSQGYTLFFAESGKVGLEIMEKENIDLVMSDMRMPEMDGATFLTKVSEKWPETMRILLTGYSDMSATIDAINKAQIFKYISKPWEDNDILLTIKNALELKNIKRDRARLEKLTLTQNNKLRDMNSNLELMVKQRTSEIEQTLDMYEMSNDELKNSYMSIIEVFSNLIAMRCGDISGDIRKMAETARSVAQEMGMSEAQSQDVYHAALLKDLGLIGFTDEQLLKPFSSLQGEDKEKYKQHPVIAQGLLMSLEPLQNVAQLIRYHREYYDGSGYPDGVGASSIPLGAKILCVVSDCHDLKLGRLTGTSLSEAQAKQYLQENSNKLYDAAVLEKLIGTAKVVAAAATTQNVSGEKIVKTADLKTGMVLLDDLISSGGLMLLPKGYKINDEVVNRIVNLEASIGEFFELHVSVQ